MVQTSTNGAQHGADSTPQRAPNGTAQVLAHAGVGAVPITFPSSADCPECDGTGYVPLGATDTETCQECDGAGHVREREYAVAVTIDICVHVHAADATRALEEGLARAEAIAQRAMEYRDVEQSYGAEAVDAQDVAAARRARFAEIVRGARGGGV